MITARIIEHIEKQISDAVSRLQEEVHDLSGIVLQNRMTQFPINCEIINTSCCSYVDQKELLRIWLKFELKFYIW